MKPRALTALLTILASLSLATPAPAAEVEMRSGERVEMRAGDREIVTPFTEAMERLGDRVFGQAHDWMGTPCRVHTVMSSPERYGMKDVEILGVDGWSWKDACAVYLPAEWLRKPEPIACHIWLHERGHAAGMDHSAREGSIMFPEAPDTVGELHTGKRTVISYPGVDRRCLRFA